MADVVHAIKGFNDKTSALTQKALGLFLDDAAQLMFTRNVFTSPISATAKIPADLAAESGAAYARAGRRRCIGRTSISAPRSLASIATSPTSTSRADPTTTGKN